MPKRQTSSEAMFPKSSPCKSWFHTQGQDVHRGRWRLHCHDGNILFVSRRKEDDQNVRTPYDPSDRGWIRCLDFEKVSPHKKILVSVLGFTRYSKFHQYDWWTPLQRIGVILGRQEELPHYHTGKESLNFVSVVAVTRQQTVQSKHILSATGQNCERHK